MGTHFEGLWRLDIQAKTGLRRAENCSVTSLICNYFPDQPCRTMGHPIFCLQPETHTDGMERFLNLHKGEELEAQGRDERERMRREKGVGRQSDQSVDSHPPSPFLV